MSFDGGPILYTFAGGMQYLTEVEIFKHFQLSCKDCSPFNRNGNMVVLLSYMLRINPPWLLILKVEFDKNKGGIYLIIQQK